MSRARRATTAAALLSLLPGVAAAQYPGSGLPTGVPGPPVTLDPGGAAPAAAPAPAAAAPAAPAAPRPIIITPDGKVSADPPPPPTNFYHDDERDAAEEPATLHAGAVPELHVVRSGDTLWDICWFYFNDPWQWPKVWSYNAQITNPHWIYPGDLVRLLPRGVFVQNHVVEPEKGHDVAAPPVDVVPAPARRFDAGIRQLAFVEEAALKDAIVIEGSIEERLLLSQGDAVYLRYPKDNVPAVGARFSIYSVANEVRPIKATKGAGDDRLGAYVRILGEIEITSVKQDKLARGVILHADHEIERGDLVGPLVKTFKNVPTVAPKVDLQGAIVAMLTNDVLVGQGELIFLDQGEGSGIEVGNRLYVIRRGDAYQPTMVPDSDIGQDDRRFPARAIGEIVVVEVGKKISVALVTLAVQEMGVGDLVMMQKRAR